MALDLISLAEKLTDDQEVSIGDQKFTGADLKSYVTSHRGEIQQREDALKAEREKYGQLEQRFQQFEGGTSALMRAAAIEAARDTNNGNGGEQRPQVDPDWQTYEADPLFSPFAKAFERRLMSSLDNSYFRPWIEKQLTPALDGLRKENGMLTTMLLDERNRREYRDLGEWPEKMGLDEARRYGTEHGYFIPETVRVDPQTGQRVGVVDLGRVHGEVMRPVFETRRDQEREKAIREEVTRELRMNANVIQMPNRAMTGGPVVKAKGKTAEEIFGNAMNDAANDLETQRALTGITGR